MREIDEGKREDAHGRRSKRNRCLRNDQSVAWLLTISYLASCYILHHFSSRILPISTNSARETPIPRGDLSSVCSVDAVDEARDQPRSTAIDAQLPFRLLSVVRAFSPVRPQSLHRRAVPLVIHLSAGYSEDSDYTSDLNYPVGGQGANSSASQFRTAANQLATPQRSLETSRENSYERDDHQVSTERKSAREAARCSTISRVRDRAAGSSLVASADYSRRELRERSR